MTQQADSGFNVGFILAERGLYMGLTLQVLAKPRLNRCERYFIYVLASFFIGTCYTRFNRLNNLTT